MMNRRHLREHFERATGPVPAGLEADVRRHLRSAAPAARLTWIMGAASAALALLVVGLLVYVGANGPHAASAGKPAHRVTSGWNQTVAPEVVPPVGAAPVCPAQMADYIITPSPPPARVTSLQIRHSGSGDQVVVGIDGGYPSRITVLAHAGDSTYMLALWGTTADGYRGPGDLQADAGVVQEARIADPNVGGAHAALVVRLTLAGSPCFKVIPGARTITVDFQTGSS